MEIQQNFLSDEETRSESKINTSSGMHDIPYFSFIFSTGYVYESDYTVESVPRQRNYWRCVQVLGALLVNGVL